MTSAYFERELTRLRKMTSEARTRFASAAEGLAEVRQQVTSSTSTGAGAPLASSPDKTATLAKLRPEILFK